MPHQHLVFKVMRVYDRHMSRISLLLAIEEFSIDASRKHWGVTPH
jgi:hypothetical protein